MNKAQKLINLISENREDQIKERIELLRTKIKSHERDIHNKSLSQSARDKAAKIVSNAEERIKELTKELSSLGHSESKLSEDEMDSLLKDLHYEQEQKKKLLKAGVPEDSDKIKTIADRISKLHAKIKALK